MNKTQPSQDTTAVDTFLASVEHPVRRADAATLDAIFRRLTGWQPLLWSPTIVGYGSYNYCYESGSKSTFSAGGFSPRKAN
jgi:hypothetical protein